MNEPSQLFDKTKTGKNRKRAGNAYRRKALAALSIGVLLIAIAMVLPVTTGYILAVFGGMALVAGIGFYSQSREQAATDICEAGADERLADEASLSLSERKSHVDEHSLPLDGGSIPKPVFDVQYLSDSMDGDHDAVVMLLEIFLDEHTDDGETMLRLADNGEWQALEKIVHTLKGVSGSIGAKQLHQNVVALEQDLLDRGSVERESLVQLNRCIAAVEIAIDETLATLRATVGEPLVVEEEPKAGRAAAESFQDHQAHPQNVSSPSLGNIADMIDVSVVLTALEDDVEMVQMLLEVFVEEHQHDGRRLIEMVTKGQVDETALRLVHTLKGVAANLGAKPLQETAMALELRLKQQLPVSLDECHQLAIVLEQTVDSARYYLHSWGSVPNTLPECE